MSNLYDVLETCLQEMENGADVDTVLFRHPEFADELRPILETSMQAKTLAVAEPSADVMRRGRTKVLQQAAQMREAKAQPSRRSWSVPLRRALVSLAVIAVLFIGSTNLVRAASTTLPGDNLYPVKRTWEDVLILLTFNTQARQALEIEHENERLDELNELFAEGRLAEVDFAGTVTSQNADLWLVSKIRVLISAQTELEGPSVQVGDAVRIKGLTQADGTVLAEKVEVLPAGIPLPSVDDEDAPEIEQENSGNQNESNEDDSKSGSEDQTPGVEETKTPDKEEEPKQASLGGVVDSINGSILVVNGQPMNMAGAEIKGAPKTGVLVKVEGYYDTNGLFIVTKIEFQDSGSNDGTGSDDNGSNDDSNDDQNNNDDDNGNDNGGDDGGGGNSGSGGDGGDQ